MISDEHLGGWKLNKQMDPCRHKLEFVFYTKSDVTPPFPHLLVLHLSYLTICCLFVWFESLHLSQQLWSSREGQFI